MSERVLLDTCVLYPTLMRHILTQAAQAGLYTPLWSPRILDEWRHAATRSGPVEATLVEGEIAQLSARFPDATIPSDPALETRLSLPDPNDRHVLAAAVAGGADSLLTLNLKDFPTRTVSAQGLFRRDPDSFFLELHADNADVFAPLVRRAVERAQAATETGVSARGLLKRARLPKLGKALYGSEAAR